MSTLAIDGGKPEVKGPIAPYNSITDRDQLVAYGAAQKSLSGFLGGAKRGGELVIGLEDDWAYRFGVKHAIAVNSATSGLLVAAFGVGLGGNSKFLVSSFTMSATVAAPMFTGATPYFCDIEPETFCLALDARSVRRAPHAIVATNLFGHPANLQKMRTLCDDMGFVLIEDAAQSPYAMEDSKYAGTIGHVGVFSLNVHKHFQSGEGGIIVTDDDALADRMRHFMNHGEMAGRGIGLNLRMTEVTAAIASSQLLRVETLVGCRIALAEALTAAVKHLPGITPPVVRAGCRHSYYIWAAKVAGNRDWFVRAMNAEGVPLRAGYVDPLYRLPAFAPYARPCPVAERLHDQELVLFEVCGHDPTPAQIKQIGNACEKVVTSGY